MTNNETISLCERVRAAAVCWWVVLTARFLRRSTDDGRIERCLQLDKGTKFRLSGGEMYLVGEKDVRPRT
jgi:hypothetical protein